MTEEQYIELNNAINHLDNTTNETNNAIKDLTEYLQEKDEKEQKEKEEKAEVETKQSETRDAQQQTQEEIYTEQLQNINTQLEATNGMLVGNFVTDGIICGVLLLTILWNKLN